MIDQRKQKLTESSRGRLSSSFRDPQNELRKSLPNEDIKLKEIVDNILAEQSKPYSEIQKEREVRSGPQRIGTTFKLRAEFYSAMWLYQFKADYILGTKFADMVENMNKPAIDLINKVDKQAP